MSWASSFGGNVFGCSQPPPESGRLTYGAGPNHWNEAGFELDRNSPGLGAVELSYDDETKKLVGSGSNPSRSSGLRWTISGTFSGNTFAGTVEIALPDGSSAASTLSLTRTQP